MGFEDYMGDAGFADEQDYMDYLEGEYCNDNSFDYQEEIVKNKNERITNFFKELADNFEYNHKYTTDIPGRSIPAPIGSKLVRIETLLPILDDNDKERLDMLFEKSYNPNLVNKEWIVWLPDIEYYDKQIISRNDIRLSPDSKVFNDRQSCTHTYFRKKWLRFYGDITGDESDYLALSMWKGYHTSAFFSSLISILFCSQKYEPKSIVLREDCIDFSDCFLKQFSNDKLLYSPYNQSDDD